jgi:hypothetical protein
MDVFSLFCSIKCRINPASTSSNNIPTKYRHTAVVLNVGSNGFSGPMIHGIRALEPSKF